MVVELAFVRTVSAGLFLSEMGAPGPALARRSLAAVIAVVKSQRCAQKRADRALPRAPEQVV